MEFEKIKAILIDEYCYEDIDITENTTFAELNFDSIDMVDFAMDIEDEFGVEVTDEILEKFVTVGDVVRFIEEL